MNFKQITLIKTAAFSALILFTTTAMAHDGKKRGHRGPPPQAIEACANGAVDQACEFAGRSGDAVSGTCVVPRRDDSGALACKPSGDHKKGSRGRAESEDNS